MSGALNRIDLYEKNIISTVSEERSFNFSDFKQGDTVRVRYKVYDVVKSERFHTFEGLCIAKKNKGLRSSFLLRRIAKEDSVEIRFMYYSPLIKSISVVRRGRVRRAKLYYIRQLDGKAARVPQLQHGAQST